jgi:hypothetical protein
MAEPVRARRLADQDGQRLHAVSRLIGLENPPEPWSLG